jgi:hypothetical protein
MVNDADYAGKRDRLNAMIRYERGGHFILGCERIGH